MALLFGRTHATALSGGPFFGLKAARLPSEVSLLSQHWLLLLHQPTRSLVLLYTAAGFGHWTALETGVELILQVVGVFQRQKILKFMVEGVAFELQSA